MNLKNQFCLYLETEGVGLKTLMTRAKYKKTKRL